MTRRLLLILGLLGVAGCDSSTEPRPTRSNEPPDTVITASPPAGELTSFEVSFSWEGTDSDGEIAFYEWRISDNGEDQMVSIPDTLDLAWHATVANDTTFVVTADIEGLPPAKDDPFWQSHTLFLRAVDDDGARDPEPAMVSFTATTLAPEVVIDVPERRASITCIQSGTVVDYAWTATDPDGDMPVAQTRYVVLTADPAEPCLTQLEYEHQNPIGEIADDDPRWSAWRDYDADDVSTRSARVESEETGRKFLIAVQAKDVAGAVTPTFQWMRNARHTQVGGTKAPILRVDGDWLGMETAAGLGVAVSEPVFSGESTTFVWTADASGYAGEVVAYRYGWNVSDPSDAGDPGWAVDWGATPAHVATSRVIEEGNDTVVVEVRDNSGNVSRLVWMLQALPIPERADQRPLLLVNDWGWGNTQAEQIIADAWKARWQMLLRESLVVPVDWIDTRDVTGPYDLLARAVDYRSIVWFTNHAENTYFQTRLIPRMRTDRSDSWIERYQARAGNLLMTGARAVLGSIPPVPTPWIFPIVFTAPQSPCGDCEVSLTHVWPYSAWCLDSVDLVSPPGPIFGDPNPLRASRTLQCDGLYRALAAEELLARHPDAAGSVVDLAPDLDRGALYARLSLSGEEFYNANVTPRVVDIELRSCQVPMYRWLARRDEPGLIEDPESTCPPGAGDRSVLDGVPVAIASTAYADTKPLRGSADFLWGFHPLGFEPEGVISALRWIFTENWQLTQ